MPAAADFFWGLTLCCKARCRPSASTLSCRRSRRSSSWRSSAPPSCSSAAPGRRRPPPPSNARAPAGRRYAPSGDAPADSTPLTRTLRPGESYLTTLSFGAPASAKGLRLFLGDPLGPENLIIQHENSPLHPKIYFELPAAAVASG